MTGPGIIPTIELTTPLEQVKSNIYVGQDLSWHKLPELLTASQFFVVVDKNLQDHHRHKINSFYNDLNSFSKHVCCNILYIEANEIDKNIQTALNIYQWLIENNADRKSLLIGIGGGVLSDILGFVAATILRGIACVFFPSTLLAQVDAAIGGKNGINFEGAKNIVGTIRQPLAVVCDTSLLASLPAKNFRDGLSEVIKYALCYDVNLWDQISGPWYNISAEDTADLIQLIKISIGHKVRIVSEDHLEKGLRQQLNFGHSLAHVLESQSKYTCSHGEAVLEGMKFAVFVSWQLQSLLSLNYQKLRKFLHEWQPDFSLPRLSYQQFRDFMVNDKKLTHNQLNFVLLEDIGKCTVRPISIPKLYDYYQQYLLNND